MFIVTIVHNLFCRYKRSHRILFPGKKDKVAKLCRRYLKSRIRVSSETKTHLDRCSEFSRLLSLVLLLDSPFGSLLMYSWCTQNTETLPRYPPQYPLFTFCNFSQVIRVESSPAVSSPSSNSVRVSWLAAPINPADINQIQGVYPVKPPLPAIGGNEGVARVEEVSYLIVLFFRSLTVRVAPCQVGSGVSGLSVGDFVIPSQSGLGTWRSQSVHEVSQLWKIDNRLPIEHAATLQVTLIL